MTLIAELVAAMRVDASAVGPGLAEGARQIQTFEQQLKQSMGSLPTLKIPPIQAPEVKIPRIEVPPADASGLTALSESAKQVREEVDSINGPFERVAISGERAGHRAATAMEAIAFASLGANVSAESLVSAFGNVATAAALASDSAIIAEWAVGIGAVVAAVGILAKVFKDAGEAAKPTDQFMKEISQLSFADVNARMQELVKIRDELEKQRPSGFAANLKDIGKDLADLKNAAESGQGFEGLAAPLSQLFAGGDVADRIKRLNGELIELGKRAEDVGVFKAAAEQRLQDAVANTQAIAQVRTSEGQALLAIDQRNLAQGRSTLDAFYQDRLRVVRRGEADQVAVQLATRSELERAAAQRTVAGIPETPQETKERTQQETRIGQEIVAIHARTNAEIAALDAERFQRVLAQDNAIIAFNERVAAAQGDSSRQQIAAAVAQAAAQERLLAAQGRPPEQAGAEAQRAREILTTQIQAQQAQVDVGRQLEGVAVERAAIEDKVTAGLLTQGQAAALVGQLQRDSLPALTKAVDTFAGFADKLKNPDLQNAVKRLREELGHIADGISPATLRSIEKLNEIGTVVGSVRALASAFGEVGHAIGDSLGGIGELIKGVSDLKAAQDQLGKARNDQAAARTPEQQQTAGAEVLSAGIAKFTSEIGVFIGAINLVKSVVSLFGKSPQEVERDQILAQNNDRLRELSAALSAFHDTLGDRTRLATEIRPFAQDPGFNALLERGQNPTDIIGQPAESEAIRRLTDAGVSIGELDAAAKATGITLRDHAGNIIPGAFAQLEEALLQMRDAALEVGTSWQAQKSALDFQTTLQERATLPELGPNATDAERQARAVTLATDAVGNFEKLLGQFGFKGEAEFLKGIDLTTAGGRQAFQAEMLRFWNDPTTRDLLKQSGFNSFEEFQSAMQAGSDAVDTLGQASQDAAKSMNKLLESSINFPEGFKRTLDQIKFDVAPARPPAPAAPPPAPTPPPPAAPPGPGIGGGETIPGKTPENLRPKFDVGGSAIPERDLTDVLKRLVPVAETQTAALDRFAKAVAGAAPSTTTKPTTVTIIINGAAQTPEQIARAVLTEFRRIGLATDSGTVQGTLSKGTGL